MNIFKTQREKIKQKQKQTGNETKLDKVIFTKCTPVIFPNALPLLKLLEEQDIKYTPNHPNSLQQTNQTTTKHR